MGNGETINALFKTEDGSAEAFPMVNPTFKNKKNEKEIISNDIDTKNDGGQITESKLEENINIKDSPNAKNEDMKNNKSHVDIEESTSKTIEKQIETDNTHSFVRKTRSVKLKETKNIENRNKEIELETYS